MFIAHVALKGTFFDYNIMGRRRKIKKSEKKAVRNLLRFADFFPGGFGLM